MATSSVVEVVHADNNSAMSTDKQSVLSDNNSINDDNNIDQEIDKEIQVRQISVEKQTIAREQMKEFFNPDHSHYMDSTSLTAWGNPNDKKPSNGYIERA
ncbi:hypothetical protein [Lentilactobacillus sp. Marseille-Q4993]|uniref:hypothetical protein n=1 Tax=Lentilactobacillus sp. Marseille-Q4993 TaxID=3039492 RepID=UPI0024BC7DD3|nr:hypothetical protein [Lentilactobacillus sp. Marseille-Q4993]